MKNGFAILGIIIGLVIGAFVVGGAAYLYNRSNQSTSTTTQTTTPSSSTPSSSTQTDTSTWKLYDNTKYAYSVKYPSDWKVQAYGDGSSIITFGDPTDSSKVVQIEVDASNPDKLAILEWIKSQDWPDPTPVEQQFKPVNDVGGVDAYQQTTTGTVYFTKNDKIFFIENGVGLERKVVSDSIFNGFLATFKFSS